MMQLMLRRFEATDMLNGVLIGTLPALIGMVLGPIISYRSDRHRGRWGRRIPYLMLTTPIAALAMVGLGFSPVLGRLLHEALGARSYGVNPSTLVFFGLFWSIFEFATIAANAVFGGLINDVVPTRFLGRFYGLFRALSLLAGMIFNFWLLGKAEVHYLWLFVGIAVLYGGGFTVMCLKVKEGGYPPPPAPAGGGGVGGFFKAARIYVRECFSHSYYLWVYFALMLANVAFMPVNLFSVFFAKSVQMNMDTYGKYIALTYLISLALSYVLGSMADRFHPLRVGIGALVLYAVVALWGGLYATGPRTFAIALVAHGVLSGTFFTATASIGQRLFPRSTFAQFASAGALVLALGSIFLPPAMGKVLDLSEHAYRYTFLAGSVLAVLAVAACLVVHRRFMQLGGPRNYVAPEETAAPPA
jgi:MFS family permease